MSVSAEILLGVIDVGLRAGRLHPGDLTPALERLVAGKRPDAIPRRAATLSHTEAGVGLVDEERARSLAVTLEAVAATPMATQQAVLDAVRARTPENPPGAT